jgi:hypothetical protein
MLLAAIILLFVLAVVAEVLPFAIAVLIVVVI